MQEQVLTEIPFYLNKVLFCSICIGQKVSFVQATPLPHQSSFSQQTEPQLSSAKLSYTVNIGALMVSWHPFCILFLFSIKSLKVIV